MTARSAVRRRRGEPLVALALLLGGWTGARILLWESPFARAFPAVSKAGAPGIRQPVVAQLTQHTSTSVAVARRRDDVVQLPARRVGSIAHRSDVSSQWSSRDPAMTVAMAKPTIAAATPSSKYIAQPLPIVPAAGPSRWHLAAWAAWRQGSGLPRVATGPRPASYGGTQLGALLQFDLAQGAHRPALHLRATYAPDRPRQGEIAVGAGLRPVAKVPVRVMAEVRAAHSAGQVEVRPAALAVTELAPIKLALDLTAEGYAQGGWVGGRYATPFADGQARLTREVTGLGPARVRLGAGAWGGAQKFARRLDVGPTVAVDLGRKAAFARLSLDYRMRVAGNASPGDGVALTLSTGF